MPDLRGEYAAIVDEILGELEIDVASAWHNWARIFARDDVRAVHEGYFSIDKKTKHAVDGPVQ